MGISTLAIIRKDVSATQLKNAIESVYGDVEIHPTHHEEYMQFIFNDGKGRRNMSVFWGDMAVRDYQIDGVLLSLGYGGNAPQIMQYLCKVFGGYLDTNDSDEKDFEPVNMEKFEAANNFSNRDKFINKVIHSVGYENLDAVIKLLDEYVPTTLEP